MNPTTKKEGILAHKDCEVCGKHFDSENREIENITIAKTPDDGNKSGGCSGSVSPNGIISMIAAAVTVVLLKNKNAIRN